MEIRQENVLITGAAGFIGAALSENLLRKGVNVFGVDNLNNYYDISLKKARLRNIENNLEFTLDREPDNQSAKELKEKFKNGLDADSFISDIGLERQINVFFRLDEPRVKLGIADSLKVDVASLDRQKTFVGLRGLRDNW